MPVTAPTPPLVAVVPPPVVAVGPIDAQQALPRPSAPPRFTEAYGPNSDRVVTGVGGLNYVPLSGSIGMAAAGAPSDTTGAATTPAASGNAGAAPAASGSAAPSTAPRHVAPTGIGAHHLGPATVWVVDGGINATTATQP